MSATGRGAERVENDFYETPAWLTRAILPEIKQLHGDRPLFLEPACGQGAIVRELAAFFPQSGICANDLTMGVDFLKIEPRGPKPFDVIITNPPYSLAQEFIEQALKWRRSELSLVVMLLRLNFLGSQKRAAWLRQHTPSVYVSPRRPSFTGKGTDATEYAWFIWGPQDPTVKILETEL